MPTIAITPVRPDSTDAAALIDELQAELEALYPLESCHGYSIDRLIEQAVAFFVLYCDGEPAGCGGIRLFGTEYGEMKRIYVRPAFRGLGLGRKIIDHLAEYALEREVLLLRLETGIHQHAAIILYERMGFRTAPRFGEYEDDPLSVFYEKSLL